MGYVAAIAFLLAAVVIAITLIQRRLFEGEDCP
jgi:multiple sugar transport system permease protein